MVTIGGNFKTKKWVITAEVIDLCFCRWSLYKESYSGEEVSGMGPQTAVWRSERSQFGPVRLSLAWCGRRGKFWTGSSSWTLCTSCIRQKQIAIQEVSWKGSSWACNGNVPLPSGQRQWSGCFYRLPGHGVQSLCPQGQNCQCCLHCRRPTGVPKAPEEEKAPLGAWGMVPAKGQCSWLLLSSWWRSTWRKEKAIYGCQPPHYLSTHQFSVYTWVAFVYRIWLKSFPTPTSRLSQPSLQFLRVNSLKNTPPPVQKSSWMEVDKLLFGDYSHKKILFQQMSLSFFLTEHCTAFSSGYGRKNLTSNNFAQILRYASS